MPRHRSRPPAPDARTFDGLVAAVSPLLKKLQVLEAQIVAMGGAPDRELLKCPKCRLQENVLIDGQFITHREGHAPEDSGLRFEKLQDDRYLCPGCGAKVAEPEPPPLWPFFDLYMLGREHQRDPAATRELPPRRGTPGWHRVREGGAGCAIDLGFGFHRPAPGRLRAGDIVHLNRRGGLRRVARAGERDLFTYRATAVEVRHGHLLDVTLDFPPACVLQKKLRLRGVTCPAPSTREGREAEFFIRALLKQSTETIVTTSPSGFDACYLADVFLRSRRFPTWEVFLNEALLVEGHAVRLPGDAPADDRDWGV